MRENCRQEYINYLYEIFPRIYYHIKKISLINLCVENNYDRIKELNLSKFSTSLI